MKTFKVKFKDGAGVQEETIEAEGIVDIDTWVDFVTDAGDGTRRTIPVLRLRRDAVQRVDLLK